MRSRRPSSPRASARLLLFVLLVPIFCATVLAPAAQAQAPESDDAWSARHAAGLAALSEARYGDALSLFGLAVATAEEFGPDDYRLAESLGGLAQTHGLLGQYPEAGRLFLRALDILEDRLGPHDPNVALQRTNLAETYRLEGRLDEAAALYRESLRTLERTLGASHPETLRSVSGLGAISLDQGRYEESERHYGRLLAARWGSPGQDADEFLALLDDLSAVLALAYFRDAEFEKALDVLEETLTRVASGEPLYRAISGALLDFRLPRRAESMMLRAVDTFPGSRKARIELAELDRLIQEPQKALESLLEARQTPAGRGIAPEADASERSDIERRIGDVNVSLGRLDAAGQAFSRALQIAPGSMEARLSLANLKLSRNSLDEAIAGFSSVITGGGAGADAYYGLAEASLRLGRFEDAAQAALRALEVDPEHRKARYLLARALLAAGQAETSARELTAYQELADRLEAQTNRDRRISTIQRDAAEAFLDGRPHEAVEILVDGIRSQPDASSLYFNLGVVQRKLGANDAAMRTWQTMLDLGCCASGDSFLVHRSLALEHARGGDEALGRRHRALYLREYGVALSGWFGRLDPATSR